MKVAFLGERGSFSELAVAEYFGRAATPVPEPEFADIFKAVAAGGVNHGIVPIENSLAGSIHQNYDLLLENNLFITGEIFLRVSHYLLANPGVSRRDIRRVYSHPQVLAQCRNYLRRHPKIQAIPVSNTAGAVRMVQGEKLRDAAAIASMQAMLDYKMACLAKNIEDNANNMTRFLVMSKKAVRKPAGRGGREDLYRVFHPQHCGRAVQSAQRLCFARY